MRIEALDIHDEAATAELVALLNVTGAHDAPELPRADLEVHRACLRQPRPHVDVEHWVVRVGGELVAYAELALRQRDNRQLAHLDGAVHPSHRRQGIGTALYRHMIERAKANGRTKVTAGSSENEPGGTVTRGELGVLFLRAMGLTPALSSVRRVLDLSGVDDEALAKLHADALSRAKDGYDVVSWIDRADASVAEGVAYLEGRMITDMPMGELDMEPEEYDVERWRAMEETAVRRLRTGYYTAARHRESGRVAAWTLVIVNKRPREHGFQGTTIVDPEHRGHRLGTLVKLANLAYAREHEPELRRIETYNARDNAHMIAVNEAMGFQVVDAYADFHGDI